MGFFDKIKGKAQDAARGAQNMVGGQPQQPQPQHGQPHEYQQAYEEPAAPEEQAGPWDGYFITNSDWYERHLQGPMPLPPEGQCHCHFGQFDPNDLNAFFFAYFELEEAEGEERLDRVAPRFGLTSKDEWGMIWASFLRHHFAGLTNEQYQHKFLQHATHARQQQQMNKTAAASAANPGLTAPVEGVTVEMWAQAAAGMAQNPAGADQLLASLGLDRARYARAETEFMARMQADTSFVIAQIYGKAFSGANGVQGGYGLGNADGSAQELGPEPCSFEQYAEIMGAMAAWGQSGQDVNALLGRHFNIQAIDISRLGGYWSTRFAADPTMAMKHSDLSEQYKARYIGARPDSDLTI